MSPTTTLAPSRAKIRAMLAPIPDAAPVIRATLSSSLIAHPPGTRASRPHLIHPDRRAHRVADRFVQDKIGHWVERRRLAIDDDELGAVLLRELRKPGRRINHERGAEHDKEIGRPRLLLGALHRQYGHRLAERHR